MKKMTPAELTAELRSYSGISAKWVFKSGEHKSKVIVIVLNLERGYVMELEVLNLEVLGVFSVSHWRVTKLSSRCVPTIFKALRVERTPHSTRTRALLHFYNRGKTPIYTIEFLRKGKSC